MNKPVTIFIEQIDVTRWKLFQQYYEPINTIIEAKVFDIRNGSASLHFDSLGSLQEIRREDSLYNKRYGGMSYPPIDIA